MRKIFLLPILIALLTVVTPVMAMQVEYIPDYHTYKPLGWDTYVGVPIDDSSAGFTVSLYQDGTGNGKLLQLNGIDGTNPYWWVWVSAHDTNINTSTQIMTTPPDMEFFLQCNGVGGWFNFTSTYGNYTWNSGYNLFRLTWNVEEWIPQCELPNCPTGQELFALQGNCYIAMDGTNTTDIDFVDVHFWAQNPSTEATCGTDSSVEYLQSAVLGLIEINYSIWTIFYDLFSIIIIILAIFGIPLLVFKVIMWIIDEVKGKKKLF